MFLSKAQTKPVSMSKVEKAQLFGVKVAFLEHVNLALSRKCISVASVKDKELVSDHIKVWKLRLPFIKVADRSGRYRPLVLEMDEWPADATSQKRISYCELCKNQFSDLESHLKTRQHMQIAIRAKTWREWMPLYQKGNSSPVWKNLLCLSETEQSESTWASESSWKR